MPDIDYDCVLSGTSLTDTILVDTTFSGSVAYSLSPSAALDKINSDWRVTEAIKSWVINDLWVEGFDEVDQGLLTVSRDLSAGGVEIRSLAEYLSGGEKFDISHDTLNQSGNSTLWLFLSGANEDIGKEVYNKISNLVKNVSDIDYCEIGGLHSISKQLGANNLKYLDIDYPIEIENIINLFSIKRDLLLHSGNIATKISIDNLLNTVYTLSGYTNHTATPLNTVEAVDALKDYIYNAGKNTAVSGIVKTYNDTEYIQLIENVIEYTIKKILYVDNGKVLRTFDKNAVDEDTSDINFLKDNLNVELSFFVKGAVDNIIFGISKLEDYTYPEQILIQTEISSRASDFRNLVEISKYERLKTLKFKHMIKFIDDVNFYNSSLSGEYLEDISIHNFTDYTNDIPVSGTITIEQENMISIVVKQIRNICIELSYQRDYLKYLSQKFALIGTQSLIEILVKEYLYRNYTSREFWRLHSFGDNNTSILSQELSALIQLPSNLSGTIPESSIKIVEYQDTTEYLNLQTKYNDNTGAVNYRFWEKETVIDGAISDGGHTSGEILDFYKNNGFTGNYNDLVSLISKVYDIGAVSANITPNWYKVSTSNIPTSGVYGTNGIFNFNHTTNVLSLTGDITWVENNSTSAWLENNVIKDLGITQFKNLWAQTPVISAWNNNLTAVIPSLSGVTSVVDYFIQHYLVTGWVPNTDTYYWKSSPLLNFKTDAAFSTLWNTAYTTNNNVVSAAIAWMKNVDRLNQDTFQWKSLPIVKNVGLTYPASQLDWDNTGFTLTFNDSPFTFTSNGFTFDLVKFNNSTLKLNETYEPFSKVFSTGISNTKTLTDLKEIFEFLVSKNIVDITTINEGYEERSYFTNNPLSGMYKKYSGINGLNNPANSKNTIHPTFTYTPFIWNLIELRSHVHQCFSKVVNPSRKKYRIVDNKIVSDINGLNQRIDDNGSVINSWVKNNSEYLATSSYYEESIKLDKFNKQNKIIDRDGPWIWEALSAFVSDSSSFITSVSGSAQNNGTLVSGYAEPYFKHIKFTNSELSKIVSQLVRYENQIKELSGQVIYQYATDKFDNHYTLFKTDDNLDTHGSIWVRYKNHPLSFPAIGLSGNTITYGTDITREYEYSQIDTTLNIDKFYLAASRCYDFEIYDNGYIATFGGDCLDNTYGAVKGIVSVNKISYENFKYDNSVRLSVLQSSSSSFEGWQLHNNQKYVGIYSTGDNIGLVSVEAPISGEISGSYLTPISGSAWIRGINGSDIITESVPSSASMYRIKLNFDSYNTYTDKINNFSDTFENIYDEFIAPSAVIPDRYNNWRLSYNGDKLGISYETAITSSYRYNSLSGATEPFIDLNDCDTIENGIGFIEIYNINDINPFISKLEGGYLIDNFIHKGNTVGHNILTPNGYIGNPVGDTYTINTVAICSGDILSNDSLTNEYAQIFDGPYFGKASINFDGSFQYTFAPGKFTEYASSNFSTMTKLRYQTSSDTYIPLTGDITWSSGIKCVATPSGDIEPSIVYSTLTNNNFYTRISVSGQTDDFGSCGILLGHISGDTLSFIRTMNDDVYASCSGSVNTGYTNTSAYTLAIVKNIGRPSEVVISSHNMDSCADFFGTTDSHWDSTSGILLEARKINDKIYCKSSMYNTDLTASSMTKELSITLSGITSGFINSTQHGLLFRNQKDIKISTVMLGFYEDEFKYQLIDPDILMASDVAVVKINATDIPDFDIIAVDDNGYAIVDTNCTPTTVDTLVDWVPDDLIDIDDSYLF